MNTETETKQKMRAGVIYTIAAFVAWGLLPLYWKYLESVPSDEILAHRIFWSFLFVAMILLMKGRWKSIKSVLVNKKSLLCVLLCSLLISANWFIYIWAVTRGHVIEASMGYYINPLLSVAFGMVVLRERLTSMQNISLVLAIIGVAVLTIQYGKVPWIALSLAMTFALYGLAKKLVNVDALTGLALETVMVTPFALAYLLSLEIKGTGAIGTSTGMVLLLLICSGVATALPLLWFARGAKMVTLSMIGFFQYLAPSISLLLGVFVFKESFTMVHFISFTFIWCGLLLYSLSYTKPFRPKPKVSHADGKS